MSAANERSTTVEIVGLVDADGLSGSQLPGQEHWTLHMTLAAWRIDGEALQMRPLAVQCEVEEEEFDSLEETIEPDTVLRMQVRMPADSDGHALLENLVGRDSNDEELNAYAEQMQRSVEYDDPVLGTFTLDRRLGWFAAHALHNGFPIALYLSTDEVDSVAVLLRTAHRLWGECEQWDRRMRSYAAEQLLQMRNENWSDEDEPALTSEEFEERMRLVSITVRQDDAFEFLYDDGELFWGHVILVDGSLADGPHDAHIAG